MLFCTQRGRMMKWHDKLRTLNDLIWTQIFLNLNSRPNSESKHIYIDTIGPNISIWLFFDDFDPSLTSNDSYKLIWPQIIFNFNPQQNSVSKNICIWYISTNRPDSTPHLTGLTQVWPLMTLKLTLKNIKFEFLRKFLVEKYVYRIHFD